MEKKNGLQLWTVAVNTSDEAIFTPGLVVRQTGAWKISQQVIVVKKKAASFGMLQSALDWASPCELSSKASGFRKRRATC